MRTHYDNLKVSKDAPVEGIQAAYRTLAKKYHPDINKKKNKKDKRKKNEKKNKKRHTRNEQ